MSKKNYYYVLVCTNEGPVFVTGRKNKVAFFDKNKRPEAMSKSVAEDVTEGLVFNGFTTYTVTTPCEITYQPYMYDYYDCKFVSKE